MNPSRPPAFHPAILTQPASRPTIAFARELDLRLDSPFLKIADPATLYGESVRLGENDSTRHRGR